MRKGYKVFFYTDLIVYPFVDINEGHDRKGKVSCYLNNVNYCDILRFLEKTEMSYVVDVGLSVP